MRFPEYCRVPRQLHDEYHWCFAGLGFPVLWFPSVVFLIFQGEISAMWKFNFSSLLAWLWLKIFFGHRGSINSLTFILFFPSLSFSPYFFKVAEFFPITKFFSITMFFSFCYTRTPVCEWKNERKILQWQWHSSIFISAQLWPWIFLKQPKRKVYLNFLVEFSRDLELIESNFLFTVSLKMPF